MDPNDRTPAAGPTLEQARDASHEHETRADRIGEAARTEVPPERAGPVTPAPPRAPGRDVNDVDDLESATDRFLGERPGDTDR